MGEGSEAVRIRLLGDFRVAVGSRTIENGLLRLKKAAALVKLLSLAQGHHMQREQAMELLWPGMGRRAASNNLRQALYAARRILDPANGSRYLVSEGESLVLCPGGRPLVDVDAFEEAAAAARRSRDPAAYGSALELYAGDLLPEDLYEEWAQGRREELRHLYLALLTEVAVLHEERGGHGPAIEALRKATAREPTFEEAHVGLMRLHALSGRPERALAQYERLRDALHRGLGTRPSPTTRRLRDEIAGGGLLPTPPAGSSPQGERPPDDAKHNLPAPKTSFVGRERELVETKRTLAMTRLLTLTGTGGSGKTRLALEVARELGSSYADGVWLAQLAPLSEPELVAQAVAGALDVSERPDKPLADTLVDTLRDRNTLLVMDNCEHLVEPAARLVDRLLDSCPRLRVLATSREALGVSGEVNRAVPSLSLPDTADGESSVEGWMRYGAVRLFVDRARLRLPDFELTPENAGAVIRVCQKLDGIPLAIELACARMGVLAVEQVAQRLEVSLDVLKNAGRGVAPRQQTLRAAIDWSHELLSEAERALLRRLSVFTGGWTLEAAEAVCSGEGIEGDSVLDLLGKLVDKSLVVAGTGPDGAMRYRMLELIRQYARERLVEAGEAGETRGRHAAFFLALAEEAASELAGSQQRYWVERLEREHDNLRAALSWVLQQEDGDLGHRFGGALWRFWFAAGHGSEGIRWLEQVLALGHLAPARVKTLEGMGWLLQYLGDAKRAEAAYGEMLDLSRKIGDKGEIATALNSLGTLAVARGDNERAATLLEENLSVLRELEYERDADATLKKYYAVNLLGILVINEDGDYARGIAWWEESLALVREAGDALHVGTTVSNLGYANLMHGDYGRATALGEEALALARELGSAGVEIIPETLVNLGLAALCQGEQQRAAASFEEALSMSRSMGRKPTLINALEGMASLMADLGEDTRAARLWGAAEAAREDTGIALPPGERILHEPYLKAARSRLGEAAWREALEEGRAMSPEDAAGYVLSETTDTSAAPLIRKQPSGDLTGREREVALLVARGLTNRQISTELSISERTAGNHVAKILRKLGLRSRTQIATWAAQEGLPGPDQG